MIMRTPSSTIAVIHPRGGTLMEVLMAIMIMAIGVISVATMFPLSMLKSVQATQLTSSTVLRYNAEAMVDANKLMIFDPDGNRDVANFPVYEDDPGITEHYRGGADRIYWIDPVGYFEIKREPTPSKPTGESDEASDTYQELLHCWVGNDGDPPDDPKPINMIRRFPGFNFLTDPGDLDLNGTPNELNDGLLMGRRLTHLPDSWTDVVSATEADITASTATSITFANTVDLTPLTGSIGAGNPPLRILILDAFGTKSITRDLTLPAQVSGQTVSWTDASPSWMTSVGNVRIEAQNYRYSWALMVRRQPLGDATVEVICFHGRPFTRKDEQAYGREIVAPIIADSDPKRPENLVFYGGGPTSHLAYVQFPTTDRPAIYKNGYVLDVQNGRFYRIQGFREQVSGANTEVVLQLSQKVSGSGKMAVFMRGVVDVYPISPKTSAGIEQ